MTMEPKARQAAEKASLLRMLGPMLVSSATPPCVWLAPCSCFWTVLQHTLATQAWLQYYIICDPALATAIHYLRPRLGYSTT